VPFKPFEHWKFRTLLAKSEGNLGLEGRTHRSIPAAPKLKHVTEN